MARIITVSSGKGGTGKTSTVAAVGCALASRGRKVLMVDTDPAQSLCRALRGMVEPVEGPLLAQALLGKADMAAAVTSNGTLALAGGPDLAWCENQLSREPGAEMAIKEALRPLSKRYELILIDSPPTLSLLSLNGIVAADLALIPVQVEFLSLAQLVDFHATLEKVQARLNPKIAAAVLPTMFDKRLLHAREVLGQLEEVVKEVKLPGFERWGGPPVLPPIPRSVRVAEASLAGKPITEYWPESPAAVAYENLAEALGTFMYFWHLSGVSEPPQPPQPPQQTEAESQYQAFKDFFTTFFGKAAWEKIEKEK